MSGERDALPQPDDSLRVLRRGERDGERASLPSSFAGTTLGTILSRSTRSSASFAARLQASIDAGARATSAAVSDASRGSASSSGTVTPARPRARASSSARRTRSGLPPATSGEPAAPGPQRKKRGAARSGRKTRREARPSAVMLGLVARCGERRSKSEDVFWITLASIFRAASSAHWFVRRTRRLLHRHPSSLQVGMSTIVASRIRQARRGAAHGASRASALHVVGGAHATPRIQALGRDLRRRPRPAFPRHRSQLCSRSHGLAPRTEGGHPGVVRRPHTLEPTRASEAPIVFFPGGRNSAILTTRESRAASPGLTHSRSIRAAFPGSASVMQRFLGPTPTAAMRIVAANAIDRVSPASRRRGLYSPCELQCHRKRGNGPRHPRPSLAPKQRSSARPQRRWRSLGNQPQRSRWPGNPWGRKLLLGRSGAPRGLCGAKTLP